MAIESLTIIGESINDSLPSTKRLFDAGDIEGMLELAWICRSAPCVETTNNSRPTIRRWSAWKPACVSAALSRWNGCGSFMHECDVIARVRFVYVVSFLSTA